MKLKLHHLNLCTKNVPEMDKFYKDILDLKPEPQMNEIRVTTEGYDGSVSFVTDGTTQVGYLAHALQCGDVVHGVGSAEKTVQGLLP
jgi:catechol 2,3-dioxygenase-like lactoylglutathione lyase family enzyme